MAAIAIRKEVQELLQLADNKTLEEVYAMLKQRLKGKYDPWADDSYVARLQQQSADLKSGKVKGKSWDEVKERFLSRNK